MPLEWIRSTLSHRQEVKNWPEMARLVARPVANHAIPCWTFPQYAAESVGGQPQRAADASLVIYCLLYAIQLLDELIDDEADGLHHDIGFGTVANMASTFQALASLHVAEGGGFGAREADVQRWISQTVAETAMGQELDSRGVADEEAYWHVVERKTPPLFSLGLRLGAVLGGAEPAQADAVAALGKPLGILIQLSDDLKDALAVPAQDDWSATSSNLVILYARTVAHEEVAAFTDLLRRLPDEPELLEAAQKILVRSGAVSYCLLRMIEAGKQLVERIDALDLPHPAPLRELRDRIFAPVPKLLQRFDIRFDDGLVCP